MSWKLFSIWQNIRGVIATKTYDLFCGYSRAASWRCKLCPYWNVIVASIFNNWKRCESSGWFPPKRILLKAKFVTFLFSILKKLNAVTFEIFTSRKWSCRKVMFSQMSVSHHMHHGIGHVVLWASDLAPKPSSKAAEFIYINISSIGQLGLVINSHFVILLMAAIMANAVEFSINWTEIQWFNSRNLLNP